MSNKDTETREMILKQIEQLVPKVGNCMTHEHDRQVSEQVKNLAIAYRCLGGKQ